MACVFLTGKLDQSDLFDYMSNWTSNQIEQYILINMDNNVLIKWDILSYLIDQK